MHEEWILGDRPLQNQKLNVTKLYGLQSAFMQIVWFDFLTALLGTNFTDKETAAQKSRDLPKIAFFRKHFKIEYLLICTMTVAKFQGYKKFENLTVRYKYVK